MDRNPVTDPAVFKVFNEIGIIDQLADTFFRQALPAGLNPSQFAVLNHMARLGDGWTPARLARAFQLTKGAMTNTLARLEAAGLVHIEPDPDDRRLKRIFLTDDGRAAREQSVAATAPRLMALEAELGSEFFERLLPELQHLRAILDAARD